MSNQVGKGKYLLSFVLLVVLTSSVYFVLNQNQVKIDIQKTYTDFFVNTNGSWDLAGREYVKIWDGTTLMRAKSRELKTFVNGNESWVLRNSTFKDNIILEEWYYINGSTSDITMFPVSHNFTVYNAEGKLLMYEVQKLTYDGPTTNTSIPSPQYFGKNMKVEWEGGNYYSKITNSLSNDKIQVKWRIDSDIYSKSARLFDPPSIAEYIYVGGANQSIIKYDSDFNIVAVSPNYGGVILSISIDDDYVYYGGDTGTVRKAYKTNLSTITDSPSYGGIINSIAIDDDYVYYGGATGTVRKAYKTNLSTITDSPSYGNTIYSIAIDDDYVYYGGSSTNTVRKAYKTNLSTITDSPSYGGAILSISIDDDYVYYGGATTRTVRKAYKTNLSTITDSPSYGNTIYSIAIDDDYVYYGGHAPYTVRKAYKTNLSTITVSPNSGGIVRSISIDDDYVYYSGYITFTDIVRKAYKNNLSTITDSPDYGGTILSISIDEKKDIDTNNPIIETIIPQIIYYNNSNNTIYFNVTDENLEQVKVLNHKKLIGVDSFEDGYNGWSNQSSNITGNWVTDGNKSIYASGMWITIFKEINFSNIDEIIFDYSGYGSLGISVNGTSVFGDYFFTESRDNFIDVSSFNEVLNLSISVSGIDFNPGSFYVDNIRYIKHMDEQEISAISGESIEYGIVLSGIDENITIYAKDTFGNEATRNISFVFDNIYPELNMTYGTIVYNISNHTIYLDVNDSNLKFCDFIYGGSNTRIPCYPGSINHSFVVNKANTNISIKATDYAGNYITKNYSLQIDSTFPNITVTSGDETQLSYYSGINHTVNFTIEDDNLDSGWYNYNGTNTSLLTKDHINAYEIITSFTTTSFVKIDEIKVGTKLNYTSAEIRTRYSSYIKELLQSIVYMNGTTVNQTKKTSSATYVLDVFTNPNPDELVDRVEYWEKEVDTTGDGYVRNRKVSLLLGEREFSITFPVEKDVYDFTIYANDTYGNVASKNVNWSYVPTEFKDIGKYFNSNNLEIDIYQEKYGHDSPINISLLIDGISMSNYTMENNSENISFEIYLDDGEYNQSLEICLENGCIYSNNYTFYVDTINPIVNITYPILNGTYYFDLIYGPNYTYEDASPGYCYYTVDEEVSDEIDAGLNFSGVLYGKGDLTITCTDYAGNEFTTDPIYIDAPSYLEIKDNASASLCGYYEYGVINITNSFVTLCPYNGTDGTGGATLNATRKFYSDNLTTFSGNGIGYNTSSCISGGGSILVGTSGQGEGGGGGGYNSTTFIYGAGGAGHAGIGGNGGYEVSQYKFNSGSAYGSVTNYSAELGSGGGSGGGNSVACVMGGIGGGYLKIVSPIAKVASTVTLKGTTGGNTGSVNSQSAGGGASGGTLVISSRTLDVSGLNADVSGGSGGSGASGDADVLCGAGGGSGGFVKIFYSTLTNTTVTSTLLGGAGGINSAGCNGGVSTSGTNGTISYILDNNQSVVTILSPLNNSKNTEVNTLFSCNATDTEGDLINLYMYLNDILINEYPTEPTDNILSQFEFPLPPGKYNITCIADEFGIFSVPKTNTFFVDYFPNVTIISPTEGTSTWDNVSFINYTYSPYYSGSCKFSLNGGTNSTSVLGNAGFFEINSVIGTNEVTVYCNNSFNNISSDTITYNLEVIKYNESTDEEDYSANFSEKNNVYIAVDVNPVFNEVESNITFNLYNTSTLINSTTFTDNTREMNFTDLEEGVYFYNVSICGTDGICEDLKERIYAKQELTLTANNGTDPLYLELGSKFLVNATENTGLAYLDLLDDGVLIYRDEINYNSTFLYNITEFVKKRFANGETEMNLTFSTDENKTIEIMAHQYDEVFYIEFNVLGEEINNSYPENFIIYSTNNSILKYFNGVLIGDRVYINKSISLTNEEKGEDSLSFYSKGRNYVDFLMDSNNVINDFEFYVRGSTGGLDYSTHFNINNSEIDYSKSTGMVRLGYLLPAGKDLKEFVYDTFTGTSINYTKWSFAQSGVITDYHGIPEYEYTMSPKIQSNQLRMDFTYSEDIPSPSTRGGADFEFDSIMNISLFNLLTTESFSLDFSFDAKVDNDCDGAGDCRDGSEYFRILAGDAVLYTTKRDYCDADTGSSCWTQTKSLEPIKINITRLNHSAVLLQLQGTQYSYSTDYYDNDCGWVKKTYNYTNSSLREQYQYGGESGCTNKPKDRTSYLANEYVVAIPAGSGDKPIRASAYLAVDYDLEDGTGTYDGDGWYTVDNVYHTIYNQSSAEIISKKIVEASSNIGQVTVDVGGSVISADYTGTPYEDFETLLYISTDGGINYEPAINFGSPTVLTNPGTELVFKEIIDMNGKSGYATAIPLAVNLFDFYNPPSYPSNVSFDFGGDGIIDYSLSEELNESHGEVKISLTNISTLNHLNRSWEGIGDTLRVPLYVYSDTAGTVELFNYNLSYNPNPIHFEGETFYDEVNSFNGLSNLSIPFRASIGNILVDTLTYSYAGGDKNYTLLLHSPDYATNQSINISLIYSKWDYEFNPFNVEYILFSPRTAVSKNVEPYGQVASKNIPLLNVTNYGYGSILGKNETELFVYLNDTLGCVNTTMSITNNKSQGIFLANEWNKIADNVSYLEDVPIYLWADYSCDYSNYWLYNPYLYFAQEINGTISDKNL